MINKFSEEEKKIVYESIFSIAYYFEDNFKEIIDFHEWKSGEKIKDKNAFCSKMLLVARLSLFQLLEEKKMLSSEKMQEVKELIYSCENGDDLFFSWEREEFTNEEKKKLPKERLDSVIF